MEEDKKRGGISLYVNTSLINEAKRRGMNISRLLEEKLIYEISTADNLEKEEFKNDSNHDKELTYLLRALHFGILEIQEKEEYINELMNRIEDVIKIKLIELSIFPNQKSKDENNEVNRNE